MSSVSAHRHRRSHSRSSQSRPLSPRARSPSPPSPTQTFHPNPLPIIIPTPALVESVAGAAHYSGAKVDSDSMLKHRRSSSHHAPGEITTNHRRVLDDLNELYCCRPTLDIFERSWNKDAVFEDPLSKCHGYSEYGAQWFALPKLFSKSEQISQRVMSSTVSPNRFVYHQRQQYTTRWWHKVKVVESIIVVDLDDDGKIVRLVDQWDGKDLPTWIGASLLRKLNAKVTPWIVSIPKLNHSS
ncbi:hypothetical protein CVT24_000354 [Panaeolus cyanescens]|uniref:SnoaL-like domain-containing protein n=1 Tax=Panaeolus cyanescens TaxID=181874 RepID=A0A409VRP6_9AGAR|nr:hypothetical protein CVT24_000354 [Panaeolus cyanescens]